MSKPSAAPPHNYAAVITVSYGSSEALQDFLVSLREHHGTDLPVVVVDNKPDADNVEFLAQQHGATYIPLPENPGYGAAMNAGVQSLSTPAKTYFFCNPDVTFIEPTVLHLADKLTGAPRLGSIAPRILNEDGTVYPSARNIPSVGTGVGHALFSRIWRSNPWSQTYKNASAHDQARPSGWLSGAAVMVRDDVYREIGGWDEEYFMHFEDIDLGYRIGLAGYTNRFEPTVTVIHTGAHSTKKHAEVVERAMNRSAIRFMSKRYPQRIQAPLRWIIFGGLKLRAAINISAIKRAERPGHANP